MARAQLCSIAIAILAVMPPGAPATTSQSGHALSGGLLLQRLIDPVAELQPLSAGVRVIEVSSHDLLGGNFDGGSYSGSTDFSSPVLHPRTYVRREDGGYVLVDHPGPGCLVRIWMTAARQFGVGSAAPFGHLQVFLDDSRHPAVDEPAVEFFSGQDRRFPSPLVNDWLTSSGGNYSYVPVCFSRHLKVRISGAPLDDNGYYQLTLLTAPPGAPVETYNGTQPVAAAARGLTRIGNSPVTGRQFHARVYTRHSRLVLARLSGAGTIRYLRLTVEPFTEQVLQRVSLQVAVDGANHPQIDVPLGSLFGDGIQTRHIKSLVFGMSPAQRSGYFSLPIPFRRGVVVALSSSAEATVRAEGWVGAPASGAGTLYGQRRVERSVLGRDYVALDSSGSGRLATLVDEVLDGGSKAEPSRPVYSPDQRYMEGDDRVYIDGARSPVVYGTGTEDIFNGGWYFVNGAFDLALSGAGPLVVNRDGHGARSMYRIFANDGPRWRSGIHFGIQHGGGDDRTGESVAVTTFSYRWARRLKLDDRVDPSDRSSAARHALRGRFAPQRLTAYVEGERNGNSFLSADSFGVVYPVGPPAANQDSLSASGIEFTSPISLTVNIDARNDGVVLRRLLDESSIAPVAVSVDDHAAGVMLASAFPNPAKRWLETDFELPALLTHGKHRIRLTLTPGAGSTATLYGLEVLSHLSAAGE